MTDRKFFYTISNQKVKQYKINKETKNLIFVKNEDYGRKQFYKKEDGTPEIPWQDNAKFIGFDLTKEQILEIVEAHLKEVKESLYESVERLEL